MFSGALNTTADVCPSHAGPGLSADSPCTLKAGNGCQDDPLLTAAKTGVWQNSVMVVLESGPRSRDHRLNVRHVTWQGAGQAKPLSRTRRLRTPGALPASPAHAPTLHSHSQLHTPQQGFGPQAFAPACSPPHPIWNILSIPPPALCDKHLLVLGAVPELPRSHP